MKKFPAVLAATVLGAAGFAAAGIASGGSLLHVLTGTTESTVTAPGGTTTTTTTGGEGKGARKVTMCHHTGSKKHPLHTISVSQSAVKAHLKHHDELGACPTSTTHSSTSKGKSAGHAKPKATTTTTSASDDTSKGHGNDKGHGKP